MLLHLFYFADKILCNTFNGCMMDSGKLRVSLIFTDINQGSVSRVFVQKQNVSPNDIKQYFFQRNINIDYNCHENDMMALGECDQKKCFEAILY